MGGGGVRNGSFQSFYAVLVKPRFSARQVCGARGAVEKHLCVNERREGVNVFKRWPFPFNRLLLSSSRPPPVCFSRALETCPARTFELVLRHLASTHKPASTSVTCRRATKHRRQGQHRDVAIKKRSFAVKQTKRATGEGACCDSALELRRARLVCHHQRMQNALPQRRGAALSVSPQQLHCRPRLPPPPLHPLSYSSVLVAPEHGPAHAGLPRPPPSCVCVFFGSAPPVWPLSTFLLTSSSPSL